MRVLLVRNYALDRQFSMLGFADCLARELPSLGILPTGLAPDPRFGKLGVPPRFRKWLAYLDKYVLFPRVLRQEAARHDLVHILDQANALYVPHVLRRPHLITCHDLLAARAARGEIEGWAVGPSGKKYQGLILDGLRKAGCVAAVSKATQDDVLRLAGLPSERVRLLYNGVYEPFPALDPATDRDRLAALAVPEPYLLFVGGSPPYKNRSGALSIHRHLAKIVGESCPALVLAGKAPDPDAIRAAQAQSVAPVRFVDSPSREDLGALFRGAQALLFPSWHEGFGIPIVEAQMLGVPVFTTDRAPMTEVGGDAAVYFDPADPEVAARTVAENWDRRDAMSALGMENARRFTSERMAKDYANLYAEILKNS